MVQGSQPPASRNGPVEATSPVVAAERAVLGVLMVEPGSVDAVEELAVSDFSLPAHQRIYAAITASHADIGKTDPLSVEDRLNPRDGVSREDLLDLVEDAALYHASLAHHAGKIREAARRRRFANFGIEVARRAQEGEDVGYLAAEAQARLQELAGQVGRRLQAVSPVDVLDRWTAKGPLKHEPTGLSMLDELIGGGLPYGTRAYIVGAPDSGKTLLVLQIADEVLRRGLTVGIHAVDEDDDDLVTRLLQRRAWRRADCEARKPTDLTGMRKDLVGLPLRIYGPDFTIEQAAADLARYAAQRGTGAMLVIDSLQTVRSSAEAGAESRYNVVSTRVDTIRRIADEHDLIAVATSEMNRAGYRSKDAKDRVSDLASGKESGGIEYGARVQITLRSVPGESDLVELRLSKNKLGQGRIHRDDESGLHLRICRGRQTLEEATDYVPPEGGQGEADGMTNAPQDAAIVARVLAENQGAVKKDLRTDARLLAGKMSSDRVDVAVAFLRRAGAVRTTDGARRAVHHYLIGSQVPDEVLHEIPVAERPRVKAAMPPESDALGGSVSPLQEGR